MRRRRRAIVALRILLLLIGLVLIGIPFLWIVLTAFKEPVAADASPPVFFSPLTLDNFRALFQDDYAHSLLNSAIITALATGSTLLFGIPAGYAFARGKFRGRGFFGAFLLFSRMVPPVIYIIPLFLFFHLLNLIGSFTGLTLAYLTGRSRSGCRLRISRASRSSSRKRPGSTGAADCVPSSGSCCR
jgi:multiple sugar transport system permease protein